ncbi:DEAD/DEAH box helicase [Planctomicrobium sp. SH668]|uniref:DEAD/DEAH box helicase n=1 Tax=Planctomicrobium sp. SH668 TaxID=3448126 RepID=UPI003F5B04AD
MSKAEALRLATEWLNNTAKAGLRPVDARLYSHQSRIRSGQPGLPSWKEAEATDRLQDAAQMIHAGLFLRREEQPEWSACIRRAGEILEWLSNPSVRPGSVPSRLLAGAAYWLAGYPARSGSMLEQVESDEESEILRHYLKGDFHAALESTHRFWEQRATAHSPGALPTDSQWILDEVVRCLGLLSADIRWGDDQRSLTALEKLDAISSLLTIERDAFSWLLARLTTECAKETMLHTWRRVLSELSSGMPPDGQAAFDRYARLNCLYRRATAWPSQEDGIRRLTSAGSFALCTPTGSGKTSVAEVAILQALFGSESSSPLCLYLVPSRALAAEVEGKMTRVLRRMSHRHVVVTGLYGGTDWGPTDAWLTSDDPTVLICTYEKGEALVRFLGPLFLTRMALVVLDEAHMVQFNGYTADLRRAESRSLRLESLAARIRHLVPKDRCRVIALSAVAAGLEDALHTWVGASPDTHPVKTLYRSTRQLIGRLEVTSQGRFAIYYDFLDGAPLAFSHDSEATPYVPSAIAQCPPKPVWIGPEKSLRPPLLWAALKLAAADDRGEHHAVLISITQKIAGVAKDFLQLLEKGWKGLEIPLVLREANTEGERELWNSTLVVCEDYYGSHSYEYRLLKYGIVLHHSSLPRPLGRLFVDVVQAGLANVVVATSTLSEGVNIPVETVLVPSLLRSGRTMNVSEFRNLAGRAGRPGVSTEGKVLVLVRPDANETPSRRYNELRRELLKTVQPDVPRSPALHAIYDVWEQWCQLTRTTDVGRFLQWLESVDPQQSDSDFGSLDSLDGFLLAGMVEHEEIRALTDWEASLQDLWRGIFASAAANPFYFQAFLSRGRAIPVVYPDRNGRRRLYKTGLPPSTASDLLLRLQSILMVLKEGDGYAEMDAGKRFEYIARTVTALAEIKRFRPDADADEWLSTLRWWVQAPNAATPNDSKVAEWHSNANSWFAYRYCWGLGSVVGVTFDIVHEGQLLPTTLEQWNETGLPWSVFWLKELVTWGTLEPVVAFLMARSLARTRAEATEFVSEYYQSSYAVAAADPLDPRAIRDWSEERFPGTDIRQRRLPRNIRIDEVDSSLAGFRGRIRVMPIVRSDSIEWIDCAGFVLGRSARTSLPSSEEVISTIDFVFDVDRLHVSVEWYL